MLELIKKLISWVLSFWETEELDKFISQWFLILFSLSPYLFSFDLQNNPLEVGSNDSTSLMKLKRPKPSKEESHKNRASRSQALVKSEAEILPKTQT